MKNSLKITLSLLALLTLTGFTACKKCGECSTTRLLGADTIQVANRGEYCGKDLKDLDGKSENIVIDSVTFTENWTCVED